MNSLNVIKKSIYSISAATMLIATRVYAQVDKVQEGVNEINPNPSGPSLGEFIKLIINVLLSVIGIVAVIMLIVGGFRYVFSQGNEKAIQGAKDTILYAIIGIVVAVLAIAIVNFILNGLR
jgi:hypothetical protein